MIPTIEDFRRQWFRSYRHLRSKSKNFELLHNKNIVISYLKGPTKEKNLRFIIPHLWEITLVKSFFLRPLLKLPFFYSNNIGTTQKTCQQKKLACHLNFKSAHLIEGSFELSIEG